MERRTVAGEAESTALREVDGDSRALSREDATIRGVRRRRCSRARRTKLAPDHELPRLLARRSAGGGDCRLDGGQSFWTDAAVLGAAGIPSILFGPGGAGLHSREEYVNVTDVLRCRDALGRLIDGWCLIAA